LVKETEKRRISARNTLICRLGGRFYFHFCKETRVIGRELWRLMLLQTIAGRRKSWNVGRKRRGRVGSALWLWALCGPTLINRRHTLSSLI